MADEADSVGARDFLGPVSSAVVSELPVFLVAALAVQIEGSLHFGPAELGLVVSLYYLSAAMTSIPLSRLAEAIGSLRLMRMGCVATGLLMIALAGIVRTVPGLAMVMVAAGMVSAGVQPATNLFLMRRVPFRSRGFAFGIKQAAMPMAVLLGGLSVPAIALTVGWRWAFVTGSVLAVGASVLLPRSRVSFATYRARSRIAPLGARARWHLIVLTCGFGLGVSAASALSTFTVTTAVASGAGEATAGLLAVLGGGVSAATRVSVGVHADRSNRPHLAVVVSMLGVGALAYVMLAVSTNLIPVLLVPGIALAYAAGWGWGGLFNLAIATRYPAQAARATGITQVGGRAGGVLGPFVFGIVVTYSSYTEAWLLAAIAAAIGAAVIYFTSNPSAEPTT